MKSKLLVFALAFACVCGNALAHNRKALRINEVMVENTENIVDDYGCHVGWIELFNANFSPLEISSVYLTTNPADPTMYPVPLGDHNTKIEKRQTVVFFADNNPTRGTFHTSFELKPGVPNWIGLYDADGKTLIDSITVPPIPANTSYACIDGPNGEKAWEVRDGSSESLYVTPAGSNVIRDKNDKIDNFAKYDSHGFAMAAMAMGIVFMALLILCVSFWAISKIAAAIARSNKAKATGKDIAELAAENDHDSGEVIAAICMALDQHLNAHDKESAVLTINKVKRAYSPWSSKIYGLRQLPQR